MPETTSTPIAARDGGPDRLAPNVLLVGELNPYGSDPDMALYHLPPEAAGGRLRRIAQLRASTYLGLWRANLCAGAWSTALARERAHRLLAGPFHLSEGSEMWRPWVSSAFAGAYARMQSKKLWQVRPVAPFAAEDYSVDGLVVRVVCLPHPSGLSRAWNDPGAADRARETLREHAPGVSWGEDRS